MKVLCTAVILLVIAGEARADTRFALIIGHDRGTMNEEPLRWAESDAARVRDLFLEIGNIEPDRVKTLLSPTEAHVRDVWLELRGRMMEARQRGEHTVLLFYFAGHADAESLHLGSEHIEIESLRRETKDVASTVLAIVDACRGAPRARSRGASRAPAFEWAAPEQNPAGFVLVSSAARGEVAQEFDDLRGALFTHHLLSGLRGVADTDADGSVSLAELYDYAYRRTLEDTHRSGAAVQHSEAEIALSGRGSLAVTFPKRARSRLSITGVRGELLVIDDFTNGVVLEARVGSSERADVAVAKGRYRVHLRRPDGVFSSLISVGEGSETLAAEDFAKQAPITAMARGSSPDPRPFLLAVGFGVTRSMLEGFGFAPAASVAAFYRTTTVLRLGTETTFALASGTTAYWHRRQVEGALSAAADWVVIHEGDVEVTIGGRAGVALVVQRNFREGGERLARLLGAEEDTTAWGIGPRLAAPLAAEMLLSATLGLRCEASASATWLPINGREHLQLGLAASLGVLSRW